MGCSNDRKGVAGCERRPECQRHDKSVTLPPLGLNGSGPGSILDGSTGSMGFGSTRDTRSNASSAGSVKRGTVMTNRNHPLGRLVILLVVLVGLEVVVVGGAITNSYRSAGDRGAVAFVVEGVHAVAKVAITVAGVAGKVLSLVISEAPEQENHGIFFSPAAASTGGAHFGYTWVSEDRCGPDSPQRTGTSSLPLTSPTTAPAGVAEVTWRDHRLPRPLLAGSGSGLRGEGREAGQGAEEACLRHVGMIHQDGRR